MIAYRRWPPFFVSSQGLVRIASTMLIEEMPEIGTITAEEDAVPTGLALVAYGSKTFGENAPLPVADVPLAT